MITKFMRIVMKFGGTSVADLDRIDHVAHKIKEEALLGNEIVVVVSAMAGVTNQLVSYVEEITPLYCDWAEYDTVVSTGEQVTAGLLALKLKNLGLMARSWLAWQIPLKTDAMHGNARIISINTKQLKTMLQNGHIAVCAGFQGLGTDKRITTIGRGGSDLTAVALAAMLQAHRCDIFTDVDGVYTADPRIVKKARKIEKMHYKEMLEFAASGARVLQAQSVAMAMEYHICVRVLSSFEKGKGTLVVGDDDDRIKCHIITGLAHRQDEIYICLYDIPNKPDVLSILTYTLLKDDIFFDSLSRTGNMVSFFIPRADIDRWRLQESLLQKLLGFSSCVLNDEIARIALIGNYIQNTQEILCKIFDILKNHGIILHAIQVTSFQISIVIPDEYTELLLRLLHDKFLEDK